MADNLYLFDNGIFQGPFYSNVEWKSTVGNTRFIEGVCPTRSYSATLESGTSICVDDILLGSRNHDVRISVTNSSEESYFYRTRANEHSVELSGSYDDGLEFNTERDEERPDLTISEREALTRIPDSRLKDIIFSTITRRLIPKN